MEQENKEEKAMKRYDFLYRNELTFSIKYEILKRKLGDKRESEEMDQREVQALERSSGQTGQREQNSRSATFYIILPYTERKDPGTDHQQSSQT
ncbi:hypothetical protein Ciccas_007791 [Cichlidogyrus casuarinus]|uniref:Uncharacterized protein n=1 Tax=Cichlidogyrus casuarinus TaxID=1844966 RepID=A0ABD2Q1W6_9PLAT